ncbi:hypothetical protein LCGC14_1933960 [marine sediment metagenome]|uniref:Uncharacterized protein n=1 Tax=marine sediment metagenome TaxID=412755 RepID=A0A0F9I0W9_9ZZZZ
MSTKTKEKIEGRVVVTRPFLGILYMQVCAVKNATNREILKQANIQNPCGTTLGWGTVHRKKTKDIEGAGQCESDSKRLHILLSC